MNLVFASGFLVPQHLPGIDYFRGLKNHIGNRHETLFPVVPPLGGAEQRANQLADKIQQKYPQGEIHIIAHSMAGLDCRILIDRNIHGLSNPGRIASLTTLSTPHRGSPVADLLIGAAPGGPLRAIYDEISGAFGLLGIDIGALADLTTKGASSIPNAAQTRPHIRYRSYFASGRSGLWGLFGLRPTCGVLAVTHRHVQGVTGQQNDGLVALDSARYGEFQEPFWQCDHADMVGHNLDGGVLGGFRFDHFAAFDAIISRL